MDPRDFLSKDFGHPHRRPGDRWAFWYFLPDPIPRELPLSAETVYALSEADSALGHLQGLGRLIKDPELLVGPYLTREAVASSRIEGTETSISDVLQAEAGDIDPRTENVAEVGRYLAATRRALNFLNQLPISQRMLKEIH